MTRLSQYRIALAFSLAVALLVAITVIATSTRQLAEEYSNVRHTTEVLIGLDAVLSAVIDAETDQRGFLLTGEDRYMAPYPHAVESATAELAALRALTASDGRRQQRLDVLEPLVREKLAELRDTLDVRRSGGADVARQRILTGRGLRLMEDIRSTVAAMKAEDRRLLTEQSARYAALARHVFLSVTTLALATLVVLGVLIWETRRRAGQLRLTRDTLQTHEGALRRSEALSRAFLESASESIVAVDAGGLIVLVNARTETMFGYPRDELIGQPVEVLIPTRLRERHVGHRAAYMAAPRVRSMGQGLDLSGRKKDGTEFPVEVSLSYVQTEEGIRTIAFIIDISERVAFQRAARQADKLAALGTLSAGIAHEINNPIGIITSRVEVMLLEAEGGELPAEMRKDLEVILHHARRVATITQGLLSFARQSSGTRAPVNLNRVVEEIFQLVRKDMTRDRIQVALQLDDHLPDIVADANAIGQVLLNLLTNARAAMPDGGEITIGTSHHEASRSVRLVVGDTGCGIPPEILSKVFDPFFTTRSDGTGLGLSISHGIVHDHHGTVTVRSEVGKGTTFTLSFPVEPAGASV